MPMGDPRSCIESSNDNIGLETANRPNHVSQDLLFVPILKGFRWVLAVAKIQSPCKILLSAINGACLDQFLGTDLTQFNSQFLADEVLSSIPTGKAQVGYFCMLPIGQIGNHPGILIVRVSSHIQYSLGLSQLQQLVVLLRGSQRLPEAQAGKKEKANEEF